MPLTYATQNETDSNHIGNESVHTFRVDGSLRLIRRYAIIMKIARNGMASGCSGIMVGGLGTAGPLR
jgi:hypothetical protein